MILGSTPPARAVLVTLALLLPLLALGTTAPATSASAPAATPAGATDPSSRKGGQGSLTVTPSTYVPGQAVRFRGNIGAPGKRRVHLQSHLGRPGDRWGDVPRSSFSTDRRGRFDHVFTAPSMFKISYRVAGGGRVTRPYLFDAVPQEITLSLEGERPESPFHAVAPLAPFTVVADTTPDVRRVLGIPPAVPGRTVSLQERADGNGWRTIASAPTDAQGHATFRLTAPALGERVLRARQERWTAGGNRIGWYASFPAYFSVLGRGDVPRDQVGDDPSRPTNGAPAKKSAHRPTASERFRWGASLFDFAWERGQDFGSPASKGTRPRGTWVDTSDGTGRAVPFNGGLVLQSKLEHLGPGDRGTTTATLHGNSQRRGRWEFRLQGHAWETGAHPYRFLLELVPQGAPVTTCSPESIVVADTTLGTAGLRTGVRSRRAGATWSRTAPTVRLAEAPFNMAVEVGRKHVTWFRDGTPIATVKDRRATLGANLVPRLSLVGQQEEMDGAQVDSDWQRAWPLGGGKQVRSGPALQRAGYSTTC